MRYAALTILSAISGLLLLATCIMWGRTFALTDDIYWYGEACTAWYRSGGGGFWFEAHSLGSGTDPHFEWHRFNGKTPYPITTSPSSPLCQRLGFGGGTTGYDLVVVAPYWAPALLLAPLPLLWARVSHRRWRQRSRRRHGRCTQCGYDLRASPTTCPECGLAVSS